MNENQNIDSLSGITETLNLSEEKKEVADGMINSIKSFVKSVRRNFSKNSEKSMFSALLRNIYIKSLSSKIRFTSVFLLSFGVTGVAISYAINLSLSHFIADINTVSSLFLIIIGLLLFTSNKTVYSLISNSTILSTLSIVYDEQEAMLYYGDGNAREYYSTPFFLGVICGIFTVIYPVITICTFLLLIICTFFIFNRPECGMLLVMSVLPFLNKPLLISLVCITFISLIYRYLLGKRHISFNLATFFILILALYICIRCSLYDGSFLSGRLYIYIAFLLSCISEINLVRSTSMFRRSVNVLIRMTRFFTVILVLYYVGNMFFGIDTVAKFVRLIGIERLISSLTESSFVAPFIAMSVPMNFAYLIGINKKNETIKNTVYLLFQIASLIYVSSYEVTLICLLSCIGVLIFFSKKYAFLLIPSPFAAYALNWLFNSVPSTYKLSAITGTVASRNVVFDVLKSHILWGHGPNIADYNGNMMMNVLLSFGIVGLLLICAVVFYMTFATISSVSAKLMKSNKARFLTIGLLCAQLSFVAVFVFTDIYCDINTIFMFAAVMSSSYASGKCYASDFIDNTIVREYKNK